MLHTAVVNSEKLREGKGTFINNGHGVSVQNDGKCVGGMKWWLRNSTYHVSELCTQNA